MTRFMNKPHPKFLLLNNTKWCADITNSLAETQTKSFVNNQISQTQKRSMKAVNSTRVWRSRTMCRGKRSFHKSILCFMLRRMLFAKERTKMLFKESSFHSLCHPTDFLLQRRKIKWKLVENLIKTNVF